MTNEPFINYELIDRVRRVREDRLLHDDSYQFDEDAQENRDLSELYRVACNFDKSEMAVCIAAALETEPLLVFQVVAEYVTEKMKKESRK